MWSTIDEHLIQAHPARPEDDDQPQNYGEHQRIFEAASVGEEAGVDMHEVPGGEHHEREYTRDDGGEQTDDQHRPTDELDGTGEVRRQLRLRHSRLVELLGGLAHTVPDPVLVAVGDEYNAEHKPRHEQGEIAEGGAIHELKTTTWNLWAVEAVRVGMTTLLLDDDTHAFELLALEVYLPGLSWELIEKKRGALKDAFAGFDPHRVATFEDEDVETLLKNPAIIRNRRKINAVITNARAAVAMRERGESLGELIASFADGFTPGDELQLTAELRTYGFVFIGPTTMKGMMEMVISSSQ